jgi:hypothetical protein
MERDVIKLWKNPSNISDNIGWIVFRQDSETDYFVREIKSFYLDNWGRIQERVQSGEWDKSVLDEFIRLGKISKPIFDKQLALLSQIAIPLWVNSPRGYDGTDYGIELFSWGSILKMTWWEEGAVEWKPLIDWYRETEILLTEILNNP